MLRLFKGARETAPINKLGASIDIYDKVYGGIKLTGINGATTQKKYLGINKLNPNVVNTSGTAYGVTWSFDKFTSILSLNGTATSFNVWFAGAYMGTNVLFTLPPGTYYCPSIINLFVAGSPTSYTGTFTISTSVNIGAIRLGQAYASSTFNNSQYRLFTNSDGSSTTNEPYVGGVSSPNVDYPQSVQNLKGINQFDKNNVNKLINTYVNVSAKNISATTNPKTLYVSIKPNTTYTVQKIISERFVLGTTTVIPTIGVSCTKVLDAYHQTSASIKSEANDKYLAIYYYLQGTDVLTEQEILDSIQIEEGEVPTEYVPYQSIGIKKRNTDGSQKIINLIAVGTKEIPAIGSYSSNIKRKLDGWYYDDVIYENLFNGSEAWGYDLSQTKTVRFFYNTNIQKPVRDSFCDKFFARKFETHGDYEYILNLENNALGTVYINILKSRIPGWSDSLTTTEKANLFKTWLSNNNVTDYVVLSTPIETKITDPILISQLDAAMPQLYDLSGKYPYCNISTTSTLQPILNLEYYRDYNFDSNGVGILKDAISCEVTEELNGQYDLVMEYPIQGALASEIEQGDIIKAPCGHIYGNDQLFKIKHIKRNLNRMTITALHIFYSLDDNFLVDVRPTNQTGDGALSWILNRTQFSHEFESFSDIGKLASAEYIRKNVVSALIGSDDNSFIKVWGGELLRDNYMVKILTARGQDRGVQVRKGKNLTGIEWEIDMTNVVTKICPVGFEGLTIPEDYVDSPLINNYTNPIIKKYEFSDIKIDLANGITEEIAQQKLRDAAAKLFSENAVDQPTVNIKVDFIELSKIEEYKSKYSAFESIYLGDTVKAIIPSMGLSLSLKIIKTVYNSLLQKYISFEIGDVKNDYVTSSINSTKKIKDTADTNVNNALIAAKANATEQLTNVLKTGYKYIDNDEIFIMDSPDIATSQKVWRWNLNGLGYSTTGISGPFNIAMTQDGQIVADFITTGTMSVDRIQGLVSTLTLMNQSLSESADKIATLQIGEDNINQKVEIINNTIENNNTKLSELNQSVDQIKEVVQIIGGTNTVINSVMLHGIDQYTFESLLAGGSYIGGKIADLVTFTKSSGMVKCINYRVQHDPVNTITGSTYTITFKYSNEEGNRIKFTLTNTTDIILLDTTNAASFEEVTYTFVATGPVTFKFECNYLDNTKGGFYTDLIISDGYLRKNWEPASGEIIGTALSVYYNGIEITSGDSSIKTIISNLGFVVADLNDIDNIILSLNNSRVLLTNTEINGTLKLKDFIFQELSINNYTHLIIS